MLVFGGTGMGKVHNLGGRVGRYGRHGRHGRHGTCR